MTILGEAGGIWPESVQSDPARGYQLKRANHPVRGEDSVSKALDALIPDPDDDDF